MPPLAWPASACYNAPMDPQAPQEPLAKAGASQPMPKAAKRRALHGWLAPASVVTACFLGCILPVIAYAEAMSALFGFGAVKRRWTPLLVLFPTGVWIYLVVYHSDYERLG